MNESEIIEGLKPICLCKGVTKKTLLQHIAQGIQSVKELRSVSGAGTGSCRGRTCTPRIEALLASTAAHRATGLDSLP